MPFELVKKSDVDKTIENIKALDLEDRMKEVKIKYVYQEKYYRQVKDFRKDVVYSLIWKTLRYMEKKGYIKMEQIIIF